MANYLGELRWTNYINMATVQNGQYYGFNRCPATRVPSNGADLVQSIYNYGKRSNATTKQIAEEIETLMNAKPFCDAKPESHVAKIATQLLDMLLNFETVLENLKDSSEERILNVIAQHEQETMFNLYSIFHDRIEIVLDKYEEKQIIDFINYCYESKGEFYEYDLHSQTIKNFVITKQLSQFLPNQGRDIPRGQLDSAQKLVLEFDNPTNGQIQAIAALIRNGAMYAATKNENIYYLIRDYLRLNNELGIEEPSVSGNLINKYVSLWNQRESIKKEQFQKALEDKKDWLSFEDDSFIVVLPTCENDFIEEGNNQHNCVGRFGYYEKMLQGRSNVVFIRRKDEPNKSFITCEVDNTGNILQFLGKVNHYVDIPLALEFKSRYQKKLKATLLNL